MVSVEFRLCVEDEGLAPYVQYRLVEIYDRRAHYREWRDLNHWMAGEVVESYQARAALIGGVEGLLVDALKAYGDEANNPSRGRLHVAGSGHIGAEG